MFNFKKTSNVRANLGIKEDEILIICPSRIIKRKGIKEAIVVLSQLEKNYKLFLPASYSPLDQEYFTELLYLISLLHLEERVIFAKRHFTPQDMPAIYNAGDLVILPSYYEGFGYSILEAMAMKKPVIGTKVVGINEAITDGVDGLLVPLHNEVLFTQAIIRITNDEQLRNKLINNAWKKVTQKFEINKQIEKLIQLYEE